MYIAEIFNQWRKRRKEGAHLSAQQALPATVYALGATSLLTDVSTEMVASILPVYLLVALKLSPSEYGLLDGLFRGGAAIVALLLGGILTSASGRSKLIAGLGYAFSSVTRLLLLLGSSFAIVACSLVLDRFGKGVRVAPRDAMLAASVPTSQLGRAFGVHRGMDAVGAMLGPLLAAFILWRIPNGFNWVFAISLIVSVFGLLAFFVFVRQPEIRAENASRFAWRQIFGGSLPPACRTLLILAMMLAVFTVGEGMIYAHVQRSFSLEPYLQPLLPVATASVFLLLAAPIGRLADRYGSVRVFACAHLMLLPMYALLGLSEPSVLTILLIVTAMGVFFAAGIATAKMVSSIVFGLLWDKFDIPWALGIYALGLSVSLLLLVWCKPLLLRSAASLTG